MVTLGRYTPRSGLIVPCTTPGGKKRWRYQPRNGARGPLRKSEASAEADARKRELGS